MVSSQVNLDWYLNLSGVRGLNVYDVSADTALDNALIINYALLSGGGRYITVPARPLSKRTLSKTADDHSDSSIVHEVSDTTSAQPLL
jgi:hypothetical protein